MLSRNEQAKKRWGGAHKSIDIWLSERQDLLVNYFKLAALPPYLMLSISGTFAVSWSTMYQAVILKFMIKLCARPARRETLLMT